jgi:hypothetical protein
MVARVFESYPGDSENSWSTHSYLSRIDLGMRARVERVEITKAETTAGLELWKASLYDSATRRSTVLSITPTPDKWQMVYQKDGVKILRNMRPLPRAWLVTDAVVVKKVEAWAAIRGQSRLQFDPRRTALLEIDANKMPALSGRPLSTPGLLPMNPTA